LRRERAPRFVKAMPRDPAAVPPGELYPAGDPVARAEWVHVAGERVRVVRGGDPAAPAVLLVHGWGASAYNFRKVIPLMAAAGYQVVAPDLRGHGGSDAPLAVDAYSSAAMAGWLAAVLDALDIIPVVAAGQSIGGAMILDLAARRPELVPAAVLLSSIGFTRLRRVEILRRLGISRWAPRRTRRWVIALVLRRIYGRRTRWTALDLDQYWRPLQDPATLRAMMSMVGVFDFGLRPPGSFPWSGARLVMLFGQRDRPVPSAEAVVHARRFRGARVEILPDVGHVPAEEVPDDVVAAILALAEGGMRDAPAGVDTDRRVTPP